MKEGETVDFEKVKKDIVKGVEDAAYMQNYDTSNVVLGNAVRVGGVDIVIRQPTGSEELLFKAWYGKVLAPRVSGNVTVRIMPERYFKRRMGDVFSVFCIRKYSAGDMPEVFNGKGYYVKSHPSLADVYVGAAVLNGKEVFTIKASMYEKDIVEAVEVAARLSKSLAKHVVPVTSIVSGDIVDYAAVSYEELLFMEILRYLLYRQRVEEREAM
jgi:hypothetical protein